MFYGATAARLLRFAPESGQIADVSLRLLCANRVLMQRSKQPVLFDHLVGAREQRGWH